MLGTELGLISAQEAFGPNAGAWPIAHERAEGPRAWLRQADLRARVAEAEARESEAFRASRSAHPFEARRSWRVPATAVACTCLIGALVLDWVLPLLSAHAP